MQSAHKLFRPRLHVAEGLAIMLAASVAMVATVRAGVVPIRSDPHAPDLVSHVATEAALFPISDELAKMIADMKLHD